MSAVLLEEATTRQKDVLPPEALAKTEILLVGCGAVGHSVARSLAASGALHVTLIDKENVEIVNVGPQRFRPSTVGRAKAEVVEDTMRGLSPSAARPSFKWLQMEIGKDADFTQFIPSNLENKFAVFSCVDDMDIRKLLYHKYRPFADFFVDGRMSEFVYQVLCVPNKEPHARRAYEKTLYSNEEADQASCTTRSSCFLADFTAASMLWLFSKFLRGKDRELNIITSLEPWFQEVVATLEPGEPGGPAYDD